RSRCRTAETGTAFWANSSQQVKTPSRFDRFSLCGRRFLSFGISSPPRVCYGKRQHPGGPTDRSRCRTAETGTAFWANASQQVKTPSRLTDSRFAAADSSLSVSRARQEFVMGRDSIQAVLPIDLGGGQQKRGPRFGPIPHSRSKRPQGLTDSGFAAADSSLSVSRARQEFVMGRNSIQAVLPIDLGARQQKRGPRFGPMPH